ncbi:MAG: hypothetical protein QM628_04225 [Propionicimonas sp.]
MAVAVPLAIACIVLGALACVQVAVACGAPWGRFVWGGAHHTLPPHLRAASAASVLLYAGFAWILADSAGSWGPASAFSPVAVWVLFGYFCLGIAMNLTSRSPAERWTMAPTCAVLALASLAIALG